MFSTVKKIFFGEKCYFCSCTTHDERYYFDENGKKVAVCEKCAEYAERKAMKKYKK